MIVNDDSGIVEILKNSKNIAVVGISNKPERASYSVSKYLKSVGYNIIPVNPMIDEWQGIKSYPSLLDIPKDVNIDVVDVFRRGEFLMEIVEQSLKIGAKVVWLQLGVYNNDAIRYADSNGLKVVYNRCMMTEHQRLFGDSADFKSSFSSDASI